MDNSFNGIRGACDGAIVWLSGHGKIVDCVEDTHQLADVPRFDRKEIDMDL